MLAHRACILMLLPLLALLQPSSGVYLDQTCSVCATCPSESYILSYCTPYTDTICAPCSTCSAGQYRVRMCQENRDTVCATCRSCGAQQYLVAACTNTSDTVCNACSACPAGQYVVSPCTSVSNTVCTACSACPMSTYTSRACSTTQDTACTSCSTCPSGQFVAIPCGGVNDTICQPCSSCRPEEFVSAPCTSMADTQCSKCTVCNSSQYRAEPCRANADTVCRACSACPLGSYVSAACTPTSDTVCAFVPLDDTKQVLVSVGPSDLSALNQLGFAATAATTRLALSSNTVSDMSSNPVIAVLPNASLPVSNFTPKAVVFPVVQEFVLDMNAGLINLTLSAPMNISVFNESRILLQNSLSNPTVRIPLANTTLVPSSTPRTTVVLLLSRGTLNSLKSSATIAKSITNSVLFADLGTFADSIGTPLNISLLTARLLIPDTSAPNITSFSFSMADPVTVVLSFSEPMALNTFSFSRVVFTKNASLAEAYVLVNSTIVQQIDSTSFVITVGPVDVRTLKASRVCISPGACFISLQPGAFLDANNNSVDSSSLFVAASALVPDTTSPSLLSFALYDGNAGLLSLSFSEPIDVSSLNTSALQLSIGPAIYASTALYLTGGAVNSSRFFTLVSITLTSIDLNEIKSLLMCRTALQCGLLLESAFVTDVSGNFINAVGYEPPNPANNNQLPRTLVVDTTPPRLTRFDLNMDSQLLMLTFDEPIRLSSFNMTQSLILQDATPATINITLSAPETTRLTTQDISMTMAIRIAGLDTTRLKATPVIAKSANNTFLTALGGLARDVASAPNVFRTTVGMQVTAFQADVTPPEFTAFSIFDATQGLIALQFSEPVNNVSVVDSKLALASQPINGRNYTLTGARYNVYADSTTKTTLYLYMTPTDLLNLRLTLGVAVSASTAFAFVDFGFLQDTSGNTILASAARPVALYVPSARPFVSEFSLNMATGVLSLTFNVVVNASSVQPGEFTLQSDAQGSAQGQTYTLSTTSSLVNGTSGFTVDLLIGPADLNAIKSRRLLAKTASSTFLSITADAFRDTSLPAQAAVAVGRTAALGVSRYVADNIAPQITAFTFALDPCSLLLNFSEVVDLTTLNVAGLSVQLTSNSDAVSVAINASLASPSDVGLFALLTVLPSVADDIKARHPLGVSLAATFLRAASITVSDMAGVALQPIVSAAALQAAAVRLDTIAPNLIAFDADMDAGTLVLTFSEYVNTSTFVPSGLTLRNAALTVSVTLDNANTSIQRLSNTLYRVQVGPADLNRIRLLAKQALLVNRTSTLLHANPGTVQDNAGNALLAVNNMVAAAFVPDTSRPQLVSFDFDFSLNSVALSFSEAVDASTLMPSALEFQSSADRTQALSVYRLTSSVVGFPVDGLRVVVNLSTTDVAALRVAHPLCSTSATTFLVLQASAVRDMYGNLMLATSASNGFPVTLYVPDLVGPSLTSFTINMASRMFVLNFDKPVNVSTFNPSQFVLQADQALVSGRSFTLTGGMASSINPFQVALNMSSTDHASVRLIAGLYVSITRSYASFSSSLVLSLSGLPVLPISSGSAQRAAQFVGDSSQAQITSFNLDMTTNTLVLSFSAVVQASSLQVSFLTLQSVLNATSSQQQVTLTSGLLLTSGTNSSISISLNTSDVNAMKKQRVCHTQAACWLTALDAAAVDSFNVSTLGLPNGIGSIPVAVYVLDTVAPVLVAFDLDMNRSLVTLEFSETVWVASLRPHLVSISSSAVMGGVALTNTSLSSSPDGTSLTVALSSDDLNALKATGRVGLSRSSSFVSLSANAITDVAGNSIPAVSGFAVRDYTPDVTRPALMFFSVELDLTLDIVLTFSEVVNASTVDATRLVLLPTNGPNNAVTISSGTVTSASMFTRIVRVSLTPEDANVVKSLNPLFTSTASSFLGSTAGLVLDVFGNPSSAVLSSSPLQASTVTIGNVRPGLLSFALDLNSGLLSLTFSETVNASTLDTSRLALTEAANGILLVPLARVTSPAGTGVVLNVSLTVDDLNAVKLRLPSLGGSAATTFLVTTAGVVLNMLGQSARARNASDPAPCTRLVLDVTRPAVTDFSLDMSAGSLVATFNEPVLAASVDEARFTLSEGANAVVIGPLRSRSATNGLSLTFNLSKSVLDHLKIARVGLSSSVSLSALAGAVTDVSSNPLEASVSPLVARLFVADSISPRLLSYALDMSAARLALTFDEPMSAASFNQSCIQLQGLAIAAPGDPAIVPRLTRSALFNTSDSSVLVVVLNTSDANNIKAKAAACKSSNTTFLTMDGCFARDVSGNAVEPQHPGLAVTTYTRDAVTPRFVAFSLDMNTGLLVLSFDEPMQSSSFNRSRVTLVGANGTPQFALPP